MKKVLLLMAGFLILAAAAFTQTVTQKIQKAFASFEKDEQLKHAISSLYVIDARTGAVVFDKNSQIGLAGASTQKIITAAAALDVYGDDFRFETSLAHNPRELSEGTLDGNLLFLASGDPTFGSWRWSTTKEEVILDSLVRNVQLSGIRRISGGLKVWEENWSTQNNPDGWIVQDIGNYYGAGAALLNWRENQFDVHLRSGSKIGEKVEIIGYKPVLHLSTYTSEVTSAEKGSGDNAYIYHHPNIIRGTIPVNENKFQISGAMERPTDEFLLTLKKKLEAAGIVVEGKKASGESVLLEHYSFDYIHYSPSLDSIIYWFLKKSVNLYGEALVKSLGRTTSGFGSTDSGTKAVRKIWKERGIAEDELNIYDGSGLSPLNRVTTHAQVQILKYAKSRDWFKYYYDAFPEFNGMKMKSGTISDVKGFCGYHRSKNGKDYIFSFLVNNYSGKSSSLVGKMYKVLDELK